MWLTVIIAILFVMGAIVALFGGGPIGFVLLAIAIVGAVAKVVGGYAGQGRDASEHAARGERLERGEPTGYAHEGQKPTTPNG